MEKKLTEAIRGGDDETARQILEQGRDPHASPGDLSRKPPLYWACRYGRLGFARELVEKYKCSPKYTTERGTTLLHLACTMGHVAVARYLATEHLLDPNTSNAKGASMLYAACHNGHLDVVRFLVGEMRCSVDSRDPSESLLHTACAQGHFEVARYLIEELGMNADAKAALGQTPLLAACSNGRLEVARYLVESRGCSETGSDDMGGTALHVACLNNHLETVAYLLQRGRLDPSCRDKTGATPLHVACRYGRLKIVRLLLETEGVDASCATDEGEAPLQVAHDKDIIRELIRGGAITKGVGLRLLPEHLSTQNRAEEQGSLVRVFVVGHPASGKSTLVKALQMGRTHAGFTRPKVKGVVPQTAGIIPTEFDSPEFGRVLVFDFAGQYEYYASHAALLESTGEAVPPLFLVVVNLSRGEGEVKQLVHYWTSFLESHRRSSASKPHLAVVGSHKDILKKLSGSYKAEISITEAFVRREVARSSFHFAGFFALDCRHPDKQHQLRHRMQQSCRQLRSNIETDSICHVLGVFLLDNFHTACKVEEVLQRVRSSELALPWKEDRMCELCEALSNRMSILFLRNHDRPAKSWIVLDIETLLTSINGRIFAPNDFAEHCLKPSSTGILSYSVIWKTFQDIDPSLVVAFLNRLEFCRPVSDPEILGLIRDGRTPSAVTASASISSLDSEEAEPDRDYAGHPSLTSRLSFSSPDIMSSLTERDNGEQTSSDTFALPPAKPHLLVPNGHFCPSPSPPLSCSCEVLHTHTPPDKFLFFPALIQAQRPSDSVWQLGGDFTYHMGWCLECLKENHFFTPRFLQILLLRVALSFAVSKPAPLDGFVADFQVFQRECTLWRNGVRWVNLDGIEAVVEMLDEGRALLLIMRGMKRSKVRLTQLRAQVVRKILEAKEEFCSSVSVQEFLVDPSSLCRPYDEVKQLLSDREAYLFDVALLARSIVEKRSYVFDHTGQRMEPLDSLAELEPYANLGEELLAELLEEEGRDVTDECLTNFLFRFSECNGERAVLFAEVLGVCCSQRITPNDSPRSSLCRCPCPTASTNTCMAVLMRWWEERGEVTLADFRSKLDEFSLFARRNILGFLYPERSYTLSHSLKI